MLPCFFAILLIAVLAVGWVLTLLGMPGNWLMVVATCLYVWLMPADAPVAITWGTVITVALLALFGELLEFLAGALAVAKAGGSRRGAVLALVGSLVGSVVGVIVGLPIPVVGNLIGAVVVGGFGALVGAMIGERWKGRGADATWTVGKAAFLGRVAGTLAKTVVASMIAAVVLVALAVSVFAAAL